MRHQEYRAVDWCDCVDDLGLIWAVALFRSSIISRHDDNAWVSKNHVLNSALNAAGKGGKTNFAPWHHTSTKLRNRGGRPY